MGDAGGEGGGHNDPWASAGERVCGGNGLGAGARGSAARP